MGKDSLIKSTANKAELKPEKAKKKPTPKTATSAQPPKKAKAKTKSANESTEDKGAANDQLTHAEVAAPVTAPAPAREEQPTPQFDAPAPSEPEEILADPVARAAKIGLAILVGLIVLIVWASFVNRANYFVIPKQDSIEIWRGDFSPTGKDFFAVLHGFQPTEPIKKTYTRKEIHPMLFDYYLGKADALLDISDLPDYKGVVDYLEKAEQYAVDRSMQAKLEVRLNSIQRITLLYKADVETGKATTASLQSAMKYLKQAQRMTTDPAQMESIHRKIAFVTQLMADPQARPNESKDEK